MRLFEKDWQTYSKVVALNYMFHREVYGELRQLLLAEAPRSFSFLDLACGDASATVDALDGTSIASYRGIDLSRPALAIAAKTLAVLDCRVTLEHRDFAEALANLHENVDVIWIGQSLHHLDRAQKLAAMRDARRLCGQRGLLVIWEPTRLDERIRPRGSSASNQRAVRGGPCLSGRSGTPWLNTLGLRTMRRRSPIGIG